MKRELFQPGCLVLAMASTVLLVPHLNANIPGSVPQNASNSRPASPPFGQTYDVLSQEWWLWDFMQAVPDNPTLGVAPCGNGRPAVSGSCMAWLGRQPPSPAPSRPVRRCF